MAENNDKKFKLTVRLERKDGMKVETEFEGDAYYMEYLLFEAGILTEKFQALLKCN